MSKPDQYFARWTRKDGSIVVALGEYRDVIQSAYDFLDAGAEMVGLGKFRNVKKTKRAARVARAVSRPVS